MRVRGRVYDMPVSGGGGWGGRRSGSVSAARSPRPDARRPRGPLLSALTPLLTIRAKFNLLASVKSRAAESFAVTWCLKETPKPRRRETL